MYAQRAVAIATAKIGPIFALLLGKEDWQPVLHGNSKFGLSVKEASFFTCQPASADFHAGFLTCGYWDDSVEAANTQNTTAFLECKGLYWLY